MRTTDNLEERLASRYVVLTLTSTLDLLKRITPNGAINHRVSNILFGLSGNKQILERKYPDDILFSDYRKVSSSYGIIIELLHNANKYVPI